MLDFLNGPVADRQLLWRGSGVAKMPNDAAQNVHALRQIAEAIVKQFPHSAGRTVVAAAARPALEMDCP